MVEYRMGDLLKAKDIDIIAHQVNCQGKMGSGIALALRRRYRNLLREYQAMCREYNFSEKLMGLTQIVEAVKYAPPKREGAKDLVANMFGQYTISNKGDRVTDYGSLKRAMYHLKTLCESTNFCVKDDVWKIGMPYHIGCGYGGGDWEVVEKIIYEVFEESKEIKVIIFKLEEEDD